jgi:hypothetical protein
MAKKEIGIAITMTESIKATRASVQIGALEVDGFMLPDGSYRMSGNSLLG